ncbi:hypothetical protein DL770_002896 [Monosporascus sp. CRB-9-2]|nr:hypothetical protein DL770_002896 [Monosporascus sp. CRB-9-2]
MADKDSHIILCKFQGLFTLFGAPLMHKVETAIQDWSSLAPLGIPNTKPHMVDDYIRQKHPDMDVEKARSLEEIEELRRCIAHYGTWATKGYLTPVYALGDVEKMKVLAPTFSTFAVLGINMYTARRHDQTDVKHGLASLLPLGTYQETEPDSERYDPCDMGPLSSELEQLTVADTHEAGFDDTSSSSSSGSVAPKSARNGVVRSEDSSPRPTEKLKVEEDVR